MVCHQSCSNDSNIAFVSPWTKSITNLSLLVSASEMTYIVSSGALNSTHSLISVGMVPDSWRTEHIVPVFKKGADGDISNYRPISLTSVPSKIMDRIVTSKILDHLYLNNIMSPAQHGFLRRRSTCTNLLECLNDWTVCVQSRQQTAIVYIDLSLIHI